MGSYMLPWKRFFFTTEGMEFMEDGGCKIKIIEGIVERMFLWDSITTEVLQLRPLSLASPPAFSTHSPNNIRILESRIHFDETIPS